MKSLYLLILVYFVLILIILEAISCHKLKKILYNEFKVSKLFSGFVRRYNRQYLNNKTEYSRRLNIFTENIKFINEFNKKSDDMQLGITQFTDKTESNYGCFPNMSRPLSIWSRLSDVHHLNPNVSVVVDPKFPGKVPHSWDWRDHDIVISAKDQGDCGSCWAFSSAGALGSLHAKKHKRLYSLSPQQLLDCTEGNNGCEAGWPHEAIQQLADHYDGITEDIDYPYTGTKGTCQAASKKKVVKARNATIYKLSNEHILKKLVYHKGPIVTAMVIGRQFHHYRKGIATNKSLGCRSYMSISHAVLLLGYGKSHHSKKKYWIIQNSYGTSWGENGYIRLERGKNTCQILTYVVGAEVE